MKLGEASDLWTDYLEARDELSQSAPFAAVTRRLEDATAQPTVPSPAAVRSLLDRVETYRKQKKSGVGDSGKEKDFETGGDDPSETALKDFTERFGTGDAEATKERLQALVDRIHENAAGA